MLKENLGIKHLSCGSEFPLSVKNIVHRPAKDTVQAHNYKLLARI